MSTQIKTHNPYPTKSVFEPFNLSLGTRAGNLLFVTGQIGFDDDGTFPTDPEQQVKNVFVHLDRILEDAGADWNKVVMMRSFHLNQSMEEQAPYILEEKAKRMPTHQHAWTAAGVTQLMPAGSQVEIDLVVAVD